MTSVGGWGGEQADQPEFYKSPAKMELPLGTAKCEVCSCLFSESEMFKVERQVACESCTHKILHDSLGNVTVERLYPLPKPVPQKG